MPIVVYHWTVNPAINERSEEVTHARFTMGFRPSIDDIQKLVAAGMVKYTKVAIVHTDNLEFAWERTNSIHNNWYENGDETMQVLKEDRSSMVGDIFVHWVGSERKAHIVAMFGFDTLPSPDTFVSD